MTVPEAERERVIAALREQAGEGRLDMDEYGQRLEEAYQATTVDELRHALRELPVPFTPTEPAPPPYSAARRGPQPPRSPRPPRPPRPRIDVERTRAAMADAAWKTHRNTYLAVIGMLVVIWLLTGAGHPWPIYPAMGWGIGLVAHGTAHAAAKARRPQQ